MNECDFFYINSENVDTAVNVILITDNPAIAKRRIKDRIAKVLNYNLSTDSPAQEIVLVFCNEDLDFSEFITLAHFFSESISLNSNLIIHGGILDEKNHFIPIG